LTQTRLTELRRIKTQTGSGRRVLAVFEDPTCPVCRQLHKFLAQLPDATIYHFPYPVVTPQALPITSTAWCVPNRAQVWEQAMQGVAVPPAQKPTCDISGLEQIVKLGETLKVAGTPTVFLANGQRLQGAVPAANPMDRAAPSPPRP
jgi:thiol:disulfide interchange protein DsbC